MSDFTGSTDSAPHGHETDGEIDKLWSLLTIAGLNKRLSNLVENGRNANVSEVAEILENKVAEKASPTNPTRISDLAQMSYSVSLLNQFNISGDRSIWSELMSRTNVEYAAI